MKIILVDLRGFDQQWAVVSTWFLELDHLPLLPHTPSYNLGILQEVYHNSNRAALIDSIDLSYQLTANVCDIVLVLVRFKVQSSQYYFYF